MKWLAILRADYLEDGFRVGVVTGVSEPAARERALKLFEDFVSWVPARKRLVLVPFAKLRSGWQHRG